MKLVTGFVVVALRDDTADPKQALLDLVAGGFDQADDIMGGRQCNGDVIDIATSEVPLEDPPSDDADANRDWLIRSEHEMDWFRRGQLRQLVRRRSDEASDGSSTL